LAVLMYWIATEDRVEIMPPHTSVRAVTVHPSEDGFRHYPTLDGWASNETSGWVNDNYKVRLSRGKDMLYVSTKKNGVWGYEFYSVDTSHTSRMGTITKL
jgi:hypothetical protein